MSFALLVSASFFCASRIEASPVIPNLPVAISPFPFIYHNSAFQGVYEMNKEVMERIEAIYKSAIKATDADSKSAQIETFDEKIETPEAQEDDGSYKPDNSGVYVPDNSGDYTPDNSGNYNSQLNESTTEVQEEVKIDKSVVHVYTGNPIFLDPVYSFSYKLADQTRDESRNAMGDVVGSYSFTNSAGNHNLNFKAGPGIGFLPTSGSLSKPNGLVDAMKLVAEMP